MVPLALRACVPGCSFVRLPVCLSPLAANLLGLAVVVADAAMLDTVIGLNVRGDDARAAPGAPAGGRGGGVYMEPACPRPGSGRWRVVVVPSGTRLNTSQLWTGDPIHFSVVTL